MKTTIRKFLFFKYTECDALEEYLEEMAQKGWFLSDVSKSYNFFTFKKGEPQKLIYSVQVFDKASVFDTIPNGKLWNISTIVRKPAGTLSAIRRKFTSL